MARKSGWQQFADNFNSVYKTFRDVGEAIESKNIMSMKPEQIEVDDGQGGKKMQWSYGGTTQDTEFTADQMKGLQYNKLADLKAKYGDAAGAMEMRLNFENLQSKQRGNKLGDATLAADIESKFLANDAVKAEIEKVNAGTANLSANTKRIIEMLPYEQRKSYAQTNGILLDNEGKVINNYVAENTKDDKVAISGEEAKQAEIETKSDQSTLNVKQGTEQGNIDGTNADNRVKVNKATVSDATVTSEIAAATSANWLKEAQNNSGIMNQPFKELAEKNGFILSSEKALADIAVIPFNKDAAISKAKLDKHADDIRLGNLDLENKVNVQKLTNELTDLNFQGKPEVIAKKQEAFLAKIDSETWGSKKASTDAERGVNLNNAYLDWGKKQANGEYKDDAEAAAALVNLVGQVDPNAALALKNNYTKGEILDLAQQTAKYSAVVNQAMATGGVEGVVKALDDANGEGLGTRLITAEDGSITIVETKPDGQGGVVDGRVLVQGANQQEFTKNLQIATNPANMFEYMKSNADLALSEAKTAYYKAAGEAQGKAKAPTLEQWAAARLDKNPNDRLAAAVLLKADYNRDTWNEVVMDTKNLSLKDEDIPDKNQTKKPEVDLTSFGADNVNTAITSDAGLEATRKNGTTLVSQIDNLSYAEAQKLLTPDNIKLLQDAGLDGEVQKILEEKVKDEVEAARLNRNYDPTLDIQGP